MVEREAASATEFNPTAAERDLKALGDYARGKWKRYYTLKEDLLPAGEEIQQPAAQSVEPKSTAHYGRLHDAAMKAAKAVAYEEPAAQQVPAPKTFEETFAQYRAALYAIRGTLSVAHSLLHNEIMRTQVGGVAWQTLGGLSDRLSAISDSLRGEIERVPEGGGLVE